MVRPDTPHSHSHLHTRNRRLSIGHLVESPAHRSHRIGVEVQNDAVATAGETMVPDQCFHSIAIDHMGRIEALWQVDLSYTDPAHRRPIPIPPPGVENRERLAMFLASVDFDCIHLVMSQRPIPPPTTRWHTIALLLIVNHTGYPQIGYPV